jgi:hypothetical protein
MPSWVVSSTGPAGKGFFAERLRRKQRFTTRQADKELAFRRSFSASIIGKENIYLRTERLKLSHHAHTIWKASRCKVVANEFLFRSFPSRGGTLDLHICEPPRGRPTTARASRPGQLRSTVPASLVGGPGADKTGLAAIAKLARCVYHLVFTDIVLLRQERRYERTVHIS